MTPKEAQHPGQGWGSTARSFQGALGNLREERAFLLGNFSSRFSLEWSPSGRQGPGCQPPPGPAAPVASRRFTWENQCAFFSGLGGLSWPFSGQIFLVWFQQVAVLITWSKVPGTRITSNLRPHMVPLGVPVSSPSSPVADGQLALPVPCHATLSPPHPAMVFISPGPRCAHLRQALGKMAALEDGQEPPRVPSPVSLESPGTPGTQHQEAQLHSHNQHGTRLAPPTLWAGPRQVTVCWGFCTQVRVGTQAALVEAGGQAS